MSDPFRNTIIFQAKVIHLKAVESLHDKKLKDFMCIESFAKYSELVKTNEPRKVLNSGTMKVVKPLRMYWISAFYQMKRLYILKILLLIQGICLTIHE